MAKYIDIEPVFKQLTATVVTDDSVGMGIQMGLNRAMEILAKAPIVEAEPVVHARWRWGRNSMNQYGAWCTECECGWEDKGDDFDRVQGLVIAHKYCPNCGAHMDERGAGEDGRISHTDREDRSEKE